jgi:hypothetical protein
MDGQLIVDCSTGEASHAEAQPLSVEVPAAVTPRQARLMMLEAGILDDVEAAIDGLSDAARIEWDYALEIRRDSPLVAALTPILGFSEEMIDAMFMQAATL